MKILFLTEEFPPANSGGSGVVAYNLARGLKNKGHDIFVITVVRDKLNQGEINPGSLKVFRIYADYHQRWQAWLSLYNPQTTSKVKRIIREIKPDIIHAHNIHQYLSYHCLKIARKYAKGVFLTAHDAMLFNYGKLMPKNDSCFYKVKFCDHIKAAQKRYNPFRNIVIRHYLKYADKIFSVSNALKKVLEINGIKNVETIYNGINVSDWEADLEKIRKFKEKYNLYDKKVIFFGGRLSGAKGRDVILKAMVAVVKKVESAVLVIAGKVDDFNRRILDLTIKDLEKEFDVKKHLVFTGQLNRDGMKSAFFTSDVCVTPSIYLDPFNLFNIEAGAAKKPVVGTCFGGAPEIVINNKTGYVVNPNNIELMTEKITDLLKNPEKAKKFGEAGYERVKREFLLERQIEETLGWYKKYL